MDMTIAALADPTRRQVIELLRDGPHRAGELAAKTQMSAPAMSRHLKVLRASGLVEADLSETDARLRIYRLCPQPLAALSEWLGDIQQLWTGDIGPGPPRRVAPS
jgi:DNA-binding transcriptional ArsR family regulator